MPGHRAARSAGALLAALLLAAPAGATTAQPPAGALQRLAAELAAEPEPVRADFAALALGEVVAAYERELERLSVPGQVSRRELAKQARWAGALATFLDGIYDALDALDAGAPVEVLVSPPGPVQFLVGERLVPVSSPRIDDPASLERAIVALWCEAFVCEASLLEPDPPPPPPAADGGWSFRDGMGSTFETADGLGFMFTDLRRRAHKEAACRRVHRDLERLAAALARELGAGRAVDFDALRLVESGAGDDQRVVVSASGRRLRIALPALARAPAVLAVGREWLRARARGEPYRQLFPRADLLLAPLLDAG